MLFVGALQLVPVTGLKGNDGMRNMLCLLLLSLALLLAGCQDQPHITTASDNTKLQVVTTLFPIYDFARSIAGDNAVVTLLLPPGVEAHAFEPRPEDAVKTAKAGLFIYTNRLMEPWAEKFVSGLGSSTITIVDASKGIALSPAGHGHEDHHQHEHAALDPHIWLDPANAKTMVATIAAAMAAKDPAHGASYRANAAALQQQMTQLDADYRAGLGACRTRTLLHGGHYAFGYLAKRYGLQYEAAVSVNADAEPTATQMASLVQQIRTSGVHYIFSEELVSPRLTETIAHEAGVKVLALHNLHDMSKEDFRAGVSYLTLMRRNLANLKTGLECR